MKLQLFLYQAMTIKVPRDIWWNTSPVGKKVVVNKSIFKKKETPLAIKKKANK